MKQTEPVEILIEELVLTGFDSKDSFVIGAALQLELGRLVSGQGIPPVLLNRTDSPGPVSFRADRAGKPADLGVQIARSVYEGLGNRQTERV